MLALRVVELRILDERLLTVQFEDIRRAGGINVYP
jgi:hypothetical protein